MVDEFQININTFSSSYFTDSAFITLEPVVVQMGWWRLIKVNSYHYAFKKLNTVNFRTLGLITK